MPSSAVALRAEKSLTPAMVAAVWEIAGAIDAARLPAELANAHWLEISTARLRGEGGRSDNVWLRECLDRLTGIKLAGSIAATLGALWCWRNGILSMAAPSRAF